MSINELKIEFSADFDNTAVYLPDAIQSDNLVKGLPYPDYAPKPIHNPKKSAGFESLCVAEPHETIEYMADNVIKKLMSKNKQGVGLIVTTMSLTNSLKYKDDPLMTDLVENKRVLNSLADKNNIKALTHCNQGCAGFPEGIIEADKQFQNHPDINEIILVSVEDMRRVIDPYNNNVNALFSDGAAGIRLQRGKIENQFTPTRYISERTSELDDALLINEMGQLDMPNGPKVGKLAKQIMSDIAITLAGQIENESDLLVCNHQANVRLIKMIEREIRKKLKGREEIKSLSVLNQAENFGNLSSASIVTALWNEVQNNGIISERFNHFVMSAIGVGGFTNGVLFTKN